MITYDARHKNRLYSQEWRKYEKYFNQKLSLQEVGNMKKLRKIISIVISFIMILIFLSTKQVSGFDYSGNKIITTDKKDVKVSNDCKLDESMSVHDEVADVQKRIR